MSEKTKNNLSITDELELLRKQFSEAADKARAKSMEAYMKDQFKFFGLPKPVRSQIAKPWMKNLSGLSWREQKQISSWFWKQEEREFLYVAMEILFRNKKQWTEESIEHFEKLILTKSWWDTVDFIAASLVGHYFIKFPSSRNKVIKRWTMHENMWLNRAAIIFQLKYKSDTDTSLLKQAIIPHLESKEFFHQKAIGWSLRQYAYTDPAWVKLFVKQHNLKPLSVREAIKHLK
ncbi:MAG TPA: DNA alkylation repair protein [Bacteroidia bacterium]|nr:DNA alkylation repair protein [Bacteroidia bacterium]HNS11356.1 DNA alkylation repair protein [Bacteroidia bacterium]